MKNIIIKTFICSALCVTTLFPMIKQGNGERQSFTPWDYKTYCACIKFVDSVFEVACEINGNDEIKKLYRSDWKNTLYANPFFCRTTQGIFLDKTRDFDSIWTPWGQVFFTGRGLVSDDAKEIMIKKLQNQKNIVMELCKKRIDSKEELNLCEIIKVGNIDLPKPEIYPGIKVPSYEGTKKEWSYKPYKANSNFERNEEEIILYAERVESKWKAMKIKYDSCLK